jgi:hypothetical protein
VNVCSVAYYKVLIATNICAQDMTSVLLLALETAASPSEAVEALLTVQAMLIGDSTAQVAIFRNFGPCVLIMCDLNGDFPKMTHMSLE